MSVASSNPSPNPVVTIPVGEDPAKMYCEPVVKYFLQ